MPKLPLGADTPALGPNQKRKNRRLLQQMNTKTSGDENETSGQNLSEILLGVGAGLLMILLIAVAVSLFQTR
jgi:hypothetical protein